MFICNHCPYVRAVIDKLAREGKALRDMGFGVAGHLLERRRAPSPRTASSAWAPSPASTTSASPTSTTATQTVARAYGAACTPDFFGFNAQPRSSSTAAASTTAAANPNPGARRELFEAMRQIADTGKGPREQMPAIGCSIKWKAA